MKSKRKKTKSHQHRLETPYRVAVAARIRLQRTKGWRMPDGARSVAYPTKWANPHRKVEPKSEAVRLYREHLDANPQLVEAAKRELHGVDLACWCPLDGPCHADVLLAIAEGD